MIVGLPRQHMEPGERRDFLPDFVAYVARAGASKIILEQGYGVGMDIPEAEYSAVSEKVVFGSYEDCLSSDLVIVLRCPPQEALRKISPGTTLLSMLHYRTHAERTQLMADLGISGVSLDQILDEQGKRRVENMRSVAWNGLEIAFRELAALHPQFAHPQRQPLRVTVMGAGAVGGQAVFAATHYGDPELRRQMIEDRVPGVEVTVVDHDLTWHREYMLDKLRRTDLLVDATARPDPSMVIVPNVWLGALPEGAVILDLAADPYHFSDQPPAVKGIEGIPHGSLDKYVFHPDDPVYDELQHFVDTTNRRVVCSCYSWPGLHPKECMAVYGEQLEPIIDALLEEPSDDLVVSHYQEAVRKAEVTRWLAAQAG